ncbi:MAG: hypothetical protein ACYCT1_13525 [Steroidobacteraceae bacterium]
MYELTIDWPPMSPVEAAEFVKPAAMVLARRGFTAGECFLEMMLQDIGEPFDDVRASAWIEAEQALQTIGGRRPILGITRRATRALERKSCPELAAEGGTDIAAALRRE